MKHLSKNVQRVLAAALMAVLLVGVAAGASTVTKKMIEANYMGIKIVVDGVAVTPKDAAGNSVEPFASNGTTYLPIRAIGEALGKEVKWDGETNTVYIGNAAHLPYQVNEAILYDGQDPNASFSVAGREIKLGVVLQSVQASGWYGGQKGDFNGSAIWNTEGFQTMTFTVGHVGDFQRNATLYIALDGVSAGEYQLRWDGSPQTITVPLGGSPNVKLTLISDQYTGETPYYWSAKDIAESYGVYDIKLSK